MKFHFGQMVSYLPAWRVQDAPGGAYEITRGLPQRSAPWTSGKVNLTHYTSKAGWGL